jgi:DnaJ-class molecular chaperone
MANPGAPCICPDCVGRGYRVVRIGANPVSRQVCALCYGSGEIKWPRGGTEHVRSTDSAAD